MTQSGSTYYYFQDALGSVRNVVDSSEVAQNTYDHYPFGNIFAAQTENVTNPYRFTGREHEAGSLGNMHYYRNRYYMAYLGIFASRDAMWADVHRGWGYGGNNPVAFADPFGLASNRIPNDPDRMTVKDCEDAFHARYRCLGRIVARQRQKYGRPMSHERFRREVSRSVATYESCVANLPCKPGREEVPNWKLWGYESEGRCTHDLMYGFWDGFLVELGVVVGTQATGTVVFHLLVKESVKRAGLTFGGAIALLVVEGAMVGANYSWMRAETKDKCSRQGCYTPEYLEKYDKLRRSH
jgi:RHS repeat-associated protein